MGYVYLYTGTGGGKTANALGLALRMVGHGRRVVIVQFCKWRKDTGECLVAKRLGDLYEIHQFGREAWLGRKTGIAEFGGKKFNVEGLTDRDRELAEDALAFAAQVMQTQNPALLVLDEINLATYWGLLDIKRVLELLRNVPSETTVVLTGRFAPQEFVDRADFVNVVQETKMPLRFGLTKGIQY